MKNVCLLVAYLMFQCIFPQHYSNKTVEVDAPGWKRVARLDGAYGRGYNEVVLMTQGGASQPWVAKISWFKGWSSYGGLNLISLSNGGYWSEARISSDGVTAHLEVNFTAAIPQLMVFLDQSAWTGGAILDGILPNGGDAVIETAKFGRINYGENDLYLAYNGKVGIGTTSPDAKLTVKGRIHTEEVKVDLAVPAPDYVFKEGYDLKSLEEVQNHIKKHGHLPNIPSAKELKANGIELGEMNMKLLEKIEELTLYVIELENRNREYEGKFEKLESILKTKL
ncbi:hypothetical protein FGF1_34980 [Flavobacteriaceae bacterium GF1]